MEYSHKLARSTTDTLEKLVAFIEERRRSDSLSADVAEFEKNVRALCSAVERAATTEELARFDVHAPAVRVDGVVHRFVRVKIRYLPEFIGLMARLSPPYDTLSRAERGSPRAGGRKERRPCRHSRDRFAARDPSRW